MLISPKDQNKLFIYKKEFNFFTSLYSQEKLPNKILIKGKKEEGQRMPSFQPHAPSQNINVNIANNTLTFTI